MKRAVRAAAPIGRRLRSERGSAAVEFIGAAVILLIPLAYLILWLGAMQNASFAATSTAVHTTRSITGHEDPEAADRAVALIVQSAREDYGVELTRDAVTVDCSSPRCSAPGTTVTTRVEIPVPLPGLGHLGLNGGPVTVSAEHSLVVDEHREDRG
ncbi:hypothetical protein M3A96_04825 [Helcobacillus massiliensis]|uniref:hypothetical protein n=1 Tax=Helcobacillus TaxID=1161125 RepID=UPI001EF51DB3|nr:MULTISPECIES: hypothetical protein [Helcobacillus]MCG7426901.1 hypothetical protein [Helcobacillus sp. ACRRO]MCT1557437.1 hypothetical protein [Helcobacillus massiliensis]MCT2036382.1 hypothetical protein [Helcobacillus massiliensis]MCT2331876.1 hypothetical protein [Helcobacillus massiliensis]